MSRTGGSDIRWVRPVALVLGSVLLLSGLALAYVRDTVLDAGDFADRGTALLDDSAVREAIAEAAVDTLVDADADLIAVRPLLIASTEFIVGTDVVRDILHAGLVQAHATALDERPDTIVVRLADLLLIVNAQVQVLLPDATAELPDGVTDALVTVSSGPQTGEIVAIADRVRLGAFVLPMLALLLFGGFVWTAGDRRGALRPVGVSVATVGALLVVVESVGRAVVDRLTTGEAVLAVYDAYLGDVAAWGLVAVGFGAIATAAVAFGELDVGSAIARLRQWVDQRTTTPAGKTVAVTGAVLVAVWMLGDPVGALRAVVRLSALVVLAVVLGRFVSRFTDRRPTASVQPADGREARHRLMGSVAAGTVTVVVVGLLGWVLARSVGTTPSAAASPGCNGSVLLCERRVDQVVFAATHNSMSAASDGFLLANHPDGVIDQLDAGYRGLLIDTLYGFETESGVVVTDRSPPTAADRGDLIAEIGARAVESAEALRDRQTAVGFERAAYLCHAVCESGATPLAQTLEELRTWLEQNPREVLVIFIQDELSPADTEQAFEDAGLEPFLHEQHRDEPFPTLGGMIDSGRRVFVMAENDAGSVPWYHDGFSFTQETPFSFSSVDDFTCGPNRGEADSPLFLVNHFVTPARAGAAADANARDVLARRLRACQDERGLLPNLVAVDFFSSGEVLSVVRELNGIGSPG